MATAAPGPRKILACIDLTETTSGVLGAGVALARERSAVLHVAIVGQPRADGKVALDLGGRVAELPKRAALADLRMRVAAELKELDAEDLTPELHVRAGPAGRQIVTLAAELDADLVVLGTHGRRGAGRMILGSVAEWVVRSAGCPVLVTRQKAHDAALAALGAPDSSNDVYGIVL